jgi:uncharacterized protein YqgC (DUF456 family)
MGWSPSTHFGRVCRVSSAGLWLTGLVIFVGVIGVVVPVLPGWVLVWAAILVWATEIQQAYAWTALAVATVSIAVSQVVKWIVPERRLRAAGVRPSSLGVGAVLGIIGFFVIPVIGLVIGFVAGVYGAERIRSTSASDAWRSARHALTAAGLSVLIELAGVMVAAGSWLIAVLAH